MVDALGVDLSSATYGAAFTALSLGDPAQRGIVYRQTAAKDGFVLGYRDNVVNISQITAAVGGLNSIVVDGKSETFSTTATGYLPIEKSGSTLVKSGTLYIYTTSDGDEFILNSAVVNQTSQSTIVPYLTSRISADGNRTTYSYERHVVSGENPTGKYARLTSVATNSGHEMTFTYAATTATTFNLAAWRRVTGVTLTNKATGQSRQMTIATTGDSSTGFTKLHGRLGPRATTTPSIDEAEPAPFALKTEEEFLAAAKRDLHVFRGHTCDTEGVAAPGPGSSWSR